MPSRSPLRTSHDFCWVVWLISAASAKVLRGSHMTRYIGSGDLPLSVLGSLNSPSLPLMGKISWAASVLRRRVAAKTYVSLGGVFRKNLSIYCPSQMSRISSWPKKANMSWASRILMGPSGLRSVGPIPASVDLGMQACGLPVLALHQSWHMYPDDVSAQFGCQSEEGPQWPEWAHLCCSLECAGNLATCLKNEKCNAFCAHWFIELEKRQGILDIDHYYSFGLSIDHGSSTDWSGYHLAGGKWHSDLWSCQPGGWSAPWSGLAAFDFDAYTDGLSRLCATDDLGLQFFGQDNLNWQFLHACFCLHNSFNGFGAFKVCLTLWVPKTALLEIWLMLLHELQPKLATSGHACHPRHLLTRTDVSWPQLSNGLKLGSHGFGLDYCHGSGNIAGCIPL